MQAGKAARIGHTVVRDDVEARLLRFFASAKDIGAPTGHASDGVLDFIEERVCRMIGLLQLTDPACARALELDGDFVAAILVVVGGGEGIEDSTECFV